LAFAVKLNLSFFKRWLRSRWLRRIVLSGLIAGLLGVVFLASFYFSWQGSRRADEVRVPDVTGLLLAEAGDRLEESELVSEMSEERFDLEVASGRILEQRPVAGASVRRGRKVRLIVSRGDRMLEIPELIGRADRAVQLGLGRDGFLVGDRAVVHDPEIAEGRVLVQWPPSGRPGVRNERVHRLVSLGPQTRVWVMPDLRNRKRTDVERWIDYAGLRRGAVRLRSVAGEVAGTVIGQAPLPGHPVRDREAIYLTVVR
jgi:serine/threonine-protein kinase